MMIMKPNMALMVNDGAVGASNAPLVTSGSNQVDITAVTKYGVSFTGSVAADADCKAALWDEAGCLM